MNKKPWYEKLSIWITIFAGMYTILGVSIFGNKSLIKKDINTNTYSEENKNYEDENETSKNSTDYNSMQNNQPTNNYTQILYVVYIQITSDILEVRTEPNNKSDIITFVHKDEELLLVGIVNNDNGETWYRIIVNLDGFDHEAGYIVSDYAKII